MANRAPTREEYELLCDFHEDEIEAFSSAEETSTKFENEFLPDHVEWIESFSVDTDEEGIIYLTVNFYKKDDPEDEESSITLSSEGMTLFKP